MKLNEIYEELLEISKNIGITVRKEKGNFSSGYCVVKDKEIIILNRQTTLETMTSVLAISLTKHSGNIYIKPAVREFIDKELGQPDKQTSFSLIVSY